jgi:hypothetical protein
MRVIVGAAVGLRLERDLAALLPLQHEDGGWGPSWIYKYGSSGIKIGNRGLTTALALNAIAALCPPPQPRPQTQPQGPERKQELELERTSTRWGERIYRFLNCRSRQLYAARRPRGFRRLLHCR